MQAEVRHDSKKAEVQQVLAAIDQVKLEMDMPAPPPADGASGGNVMETPPFEENGRRCVSLFQSPAISGYGRSSAWLVQEASSVFGADWYESSSHL